MTTRARATTTITPVTTTPARATITTVATIASARGHGRRALAGGPPTRPWAPPARRASSGPAGRGAPATTITPAMTTTPPVTTTTPRATMIIRPTTTITGRSARWTE